MGVARETAGKLNRKKEVIRRSIRVVAEGGNAVLPELSLNTYPQATVNFRNAGRPELQID